MKKLICSIHDAKAEAWLPPLFFQAKGQAIRSFSDVVNDPSSEFGRHPEDYTLYVIGTFDELNGTVEPLDFELLGNGVNFKDGEVVK